MMRRLVLVAVFLFLLAGIAGAVIDEEHRLTSAHWMPTAYTLNKGEILIGIGPLAYGVADKLEVGTNMLLDILQILNISGKYNFVDGRNFALAGNVSFQHFSLLDVNYNALGIGANVSIPINPKFKLHTGASYVYIPDLDIEGEDFKGTSAIGSTIPLDFEYVMDAHNAILGGAAYDITFEGFRVGASYLHSWQKFNLQLGGGFGSFAGYTLFMPTIGIWWRF